MKSFLLLSCLMAAVTDVTAGSGGGGDTPPDSSTTPPPPPVAKAETEIVVPAPPKGADFDTVAAMHQQLLSEASPVADAFHKKHVLGFKSK